MLRRALRRRVGGRRRRPRERRGRRRAGRALAAGLARALQPVRADERAVAAQCRRARRGAREPADAAPRADDRRRRAAQRRPGRRNARGRDRGGPATGGSCPRRCRSPSRCSSRPRGGRPPPARCVRWRALAARSRCRRRAPAPRRADRQRRPGQGMFADVLAELLAAHETFAVDCAGDLRVGGVAGTPRPVRVGQPVRRLGAARVGDRGGRRGHQRHRPAQLDRRSRPRRPSPARPGQRAPGLHGDRAGHRPRADRRRGGGAGQARAVARARGRGGGPADGGVVVYDDGGHDVLAPRPSPASVTIPACAASSSPQPSSR